MRGEAMKVAVIGAGSTYTPELVSGLMRERERLGVSELVLHDIDAQRREVVGGLAKRILERQGYSGSVQLT
ncbi:MAG: 6-phospho-beta-glucosidase, partial [Solirubrobacterales bacterium]|nr:6-phospho-beta-glucosidase [Solirubrobacterales bacterium]